MLNQGHLSETTSGVVELSNGSFTIEGDKITFAEEVTSPKEKSMCGSNATYSDHWKFDAKKGELLFTQDKDDCDVWMVLAFVPSVQA